MAKQFLCAILLLLSISRLEAEATFNADLMISVTPANSTAATVVAEGQAYLTEKATGQFSGTYSDNLAGGAGPYPASGKNVDSATGSGLYTIHTGAGTFVFVFTVSGTNYSTTGVSLPSAYGPGATFTVTAQQPAFTNVNGIAVTLGNADSSFPAVGPVLPVTTGTLNIQTDSFHFIVPGRDSHPGSAFIYTLKGHTHVVPITSYGMFVPPDFSGGGYLTVALKVGPLTLNIEDAPEQDGATVVYEGTAYGGYGKTTVECNFSATPP